MPDNSIIKVKLSVPGLPPASQLNQFNLRRDSNRFEFNNQTVEFYVNESRNDYDFWFVLENVEPECNIEIIPRERIFFLSAETATSEDFFISDSGMRDFLSQFGRVYSHSFWPNDNHYPSIPFLPWMYFANHGETIWAPKTQQTNVWETSEILKRDKLFSLFCSDQTMTTMHRVRYRFAQRLASEYPEHVDWFGNGINALPTKSEGIAPYKYHFALENKRQNNIISEKLYDSFLGLAVPLYWGAPNVSQFFDPESLIEIDIFDFKSTAMTIERIINNDPYYDFLPKLKVQREKVLSGNFLYRMAEIAVTAQGEMPEKNATAQIEIFPRTKFVKRESWRYRFAKNVYFKFFAQ